MHTVPFKAGFPLITIDIARLRSELYFPGESLFFPDPSGRSLFLLLTVFFYLEVLWSSELVYYVPDALVNGVKTCR